MHTIPFFKGGTMKKISLWIMIMVCCMMSLTPLSAKEAFDIEKANIEMVVHENGSIDITETYDLKFLQRRHGFYRNIPTVYDMDWNVDGVKEKKSYYFPISHIECDGPYKVEKNYDGISIRLGDEDEEVIGKQSYRLSYRVQTKDLDLDGIQMLYWNLIGSFDTTIKDFTYRITMPKAFDSENIYVSTGRYGQNNNKLSVKVDGNIISGHNTKMLFSQEQATIMVNLPKDYFTFTKDKNYDTYVIGITLIILLGSLILFIRFGKDDEVIVTVEFDPPKDLDSAGVGYVIDHIVDDRDAVSLILKWANNGNILIHDENEGFQLEKRKELGIEANDYERTLFSAIFSKDYIVKEDDLKTEKMSKAMNETKIQIQNHFKKENQVYMKASLVLQCVMLFIVVLPQAIASFAGAYAKYDAISLSLPFMIPSLILLITIIPWILFIRKRYAMKRSTFFILMIVLLICNGICIGAGVILQMQLETSWYVILLTTLVTLGLLVIMVFMDKRSKKGNAWLGQILGLKEFIESCEKDRIEALAKDDPYAFFKVLPYAYVLGISDVWVKKFENIGLPNPGWYVGNQGDVFMSMLWWNHFHYCMRDISKAVCYIPPAKSGSGGGSFSSGGFGGGGFSGGGFGGGSGGSW